MTEDATQTCPVFENSYAANCNTEAKNSKLVNQS